MSIFVIVAGLIFMFLGIIWKTGSWLNVSLKFTMYIMTIWAVILVVKGGLL